MKAKTSARPLVTLGTKAIVRLWRCGKAEKAWPPGGEEGVIEEDRSDPGDRWRIPEGLANEESIMAIAEALRLGSGRSWEDSWST